MPMNDTYLNLTVDAGKAAITHIGLVNGSAVELTGGTYARQPVTWTAATAGLVRPTANLVFNVPSGSTVAGWRGFSALTSGTNYGGHTLTSVGPYASDGTYTLTAASTGIDHDGV
jgi:hypothetical protein